MTTLPVDLAPQPALPPATRWAVVWWADGVRHERYSDDRALADNPSSAPTALASSIMSACPAGSPRRD